MKASLIKNEKSVSEKLKKKKIKEKPNFKIGDLVRTADERKVFPNGDTLLGPMSYTK